LARSDVADVDYILHVASPFVLAKPRDPNELITPAVEGHLKSFVLLRKLKFVKGESSSLPLVLQSCKGKRREYSDDDWSDNIFTKYPMN
jgi:hypothetical protein